MTITSTARQTCLVRSESQIVADFDKIVPTHLSEINLGNESECRSIGEEGRGDGYLHGCGMYRGTKVRGHLLFVVEPVGCSRSGELRQILPPVPNVVNANTFAASCVMSTYASEHMTVKRITISRRPDLDPYTSNLCTRVIGASMGIRAALNVHFVDSGRLLSQLRAVNTQASTPFRIIPVLKYGRRSRWHACSIHSQSVRTGPETIVLS